MYGFAARSSADGCYDGTVPYTIEPFKIIEPSNHRQHHQQRVITAVTHRPWINKNKLKWYLYFMVFWRFYAFPISGFYRHSMWNNIFLIYLFFFCFHQRMSIRGSRHTRISHIYIVTQTNHIHASAYEMATHSCIMYAVGERKITTATTTTKSWTRSIRSFVCTYVRTTWNESSIKCME